jgi:Transglutaminase-like superfamily
MHNGVDRDRGARPISSGLEDLIRLSDEELARVDPLMMNLLVARGTPALGRLDIGPFQRLADQWAAEVARCVAEDEPAFHRTPGAWKNDLAFFRLGVLCWYVDEVLDIHYREDQRDLQAVAYTDPRDLFLNGVMDTRRGTCGNMPALHVALGWRLGWPVSLACAGWHLLCRYDDGQRTHNIEATNNGHGGFHSHPDDYYRQQYHLPDEAIQGGSDLTALRPRQLLGLFVGLRARHWDDIGCSEPACRDYHLARDLFPNSLLLQRKAREAHTQRARAAWYPAGRVVAQPEIISPRD